MTPTLKEAVEVLCDALAKDTSENVNSLYYTWQSNIAITMLDEFLKQGLISQGTKLYSEYHTACNKGARNFLDLLIRDAKNDYPDD